MHRLTTAICVFAATIMLVGVEECQAENPGRILSSSSVPLKVSHPVRIRLTTNGSPTQSPADFLNESIWYVGLKGIVIPQAGLGINKVVAYSPAALAGLEAGMVIISCNGIRIAEEADMLRAIHDSGGIVTMVVLLEDGGQGEVVVEMVRMSSISF